MADWYGGIFELLEGMANEEQARRMAAYMKNRFRFLGIRKPELDAAVKPYLRMVSKLDIDRGFILLCWEKPYREAQYVASDYLVAHRKQTIEPDIDLVETLITSKSWWDTVDILDAVCGTLVARYPHLKRRMLEWSKSDNIWLRRAAIDFQQRYKEATDVSLLEEIILNNTGSGEFFIDKAIGWSLREYAKTAPDWVKRFLSTHGDELAPLSVREAKAAFPVDKNRSS